MADQLPVIDDDDDDELQENGAASSQQHGNPFSPTSQGQGAQGVYVSVDDLRVMMQQMTAATKAASDAAMAAVRANSSKASLGSSEMSRILPRPDTFKPTTREEEHSQWLQWVWSLKQYVVALDTAYAEDLKKIEQFPTAEIGWISDPDALQRSQRMYALLSGLVRGRGLQVIQRVPSQNGYEALRQLMQLFQPSSRARSLGILTADAPVSHQRAVPGPAVGSGASDGGIRAFVWQEAGRRLQNLDTAQEHFWRHAEPPVHRPDGDLLLRRDQRGSSSL